MYGIPKQEGAHTLISALNLKHQHELEINLISAHAEATFASVYIFWVGYQHWVM